MKQTIGIYLYIFTLGLLLSAAFIYGLLRGSGIAE